MRRTTFSGCSPSCRHKLTNVCAQERLDVETECTDVDAG